MKVSMIALYRTRDFSRIGTCYKLSGFLGLTKYYGVVRNIGIIIYEITISLQHELSLKVKMLSSLFKFFILKIRIMELTVTRDLVSE